MKYILTITLLCTFIRGIIAASPPSDSICTLTGDIRGLGNHRIIFSYCPTDSICHGDTIRARHGHFIFTAHLNGPTYFRITTLRDDTRKRDKRTGYSVAYRGKYGLRYGTFRDALLENKTMTWKVNKLSMFRRSAISNAPINDTMMYIENISTRIYHSDTALRRWSKQNPIPWSKIVPARRLIERDSLAQSMYKRQGDSIAAYIIAHPSSYASANALWRVMYSDHAVREAAYNALDTSFRHLADVRSYKKRIDQISAHISRGDIGPEISQADTSGRMVLLSSFRGKVTLVDFWASWCGPCRKENPTVVSAYHKFHNKGLEIYSVSLDTDKSRWEAAIQKDKLSWTHVSDLKDWNSAAQAYGVHGIPNNFLLDKSGKVIATNLRGKELNAALKEVFK